MRFELTDKAPFIVVKASLNGKGPFKFVVDTGSSVTVVDQDAVETLGIHKDSNSATSCCSPKMLAVGSMQIGSVRMSRVPMALGNLSPLSKETGIQWDGIIGSPFLKDYQVVIDYPRREITFEEPRQEHRLPIKFRLVGDANFIVVKTKLNEKGPFNFLVDTGATRTTVTEQIGQIFDLHRTSHGKRTSLSGSYARTTMILSKLKSIQVGKAKSTDVEVGVLGLEPPCDGVGVPLDGVLGYTFMKDYRVTINYPRREMSFKREHELKIDDVS